MRAQDATDLTPTESKTLETLVVTEVKGQPGVQIVPLSYLDDLISMAVVAAKLPSGAHGRWHYIASSVVTVATKNGIDEFVTHDVVAESDLPSLAHSVAYQFATARFRAASGLFLETEKRYGHGRTTTASKTN